MTSRHPRVLFVYPIEASFVQNDLHLLQSFCDVTKFHFRGRSDYTGLLRSIRRSDIVFCWFALEFASVAVCLARLSARKSVVVAGGFDVSGLPEIGYGRLLKRRGRIEARVALRVADQVLAFSESSAQAIRKLSPKSNVRSAYLCVDLEAFHPAKKDEVVITVAHVSRENLIRKGLTTFVRCAALVPEAKFVLVGRHWDDAGTTLRSMATKNVELTGWLPAKELHELLARSKVYVQASYTEGFGLALAEAMASGCVPVVTRRGAIPEIVGNAGFYAEYGDEAAFAKRIREALRSETGTDARRRVERLFSVERRSQELRRVIAQLGDRHTRLSCLKRGSATAVHEGVNR